MRTAGPRANSLIPTLVERLGVTRSQSFNFHLCGSTMQFVWYSLAAFALLFSSRTASATPPNIVVLFSDDAGYADFGFQPNVVEEMRTLTPHIDTIARDGARCSNAYMAGCVCSPSRAGLMTGRNPGRFGFDNNLPPGTKNGLSLEETFASKRLQKLGYDTALIGKWHLGYPEEFHPNRRGWDWFYGLLQGSRPYFPIKNPSPHRVILDNNTPTPEVGYVTDRIGDAACKFIKKQSTGDQKAQPFFLFVSFTTPHGPLQPKPEDLQRLAHITDRKRKSYAGLIFSLDDNVGKILKCLKSHGCDDNTLVIFTNDNGGQTQTGADNTPLRGRKGDFFEGGIRVPMAMRWPGKIAPGAVIDEPICAIDFLPTFVNLAGGKVDPAWKLDGINLQPLLTGETKSLPTRPLFWRKGGADGTYAVRDGRWKLYVNRSDNSKPMLFDLSNDIGEARDLATEHPEVVKQLTAKLTVWSTGLVKPWWGPASAKRSRKQP